MPNRLWGFIIAIVLVATACTPSPDLRNEAFFQDTSLIDGEPCFAPCWRNLIPGETLWEEGVEALQNFEDVSSMVRVRNLDDDQNAFDFQYGDGPQCCRVFTRDGTTLASILLLVVPEMSVGQVIEQYGEPQYIQGNDVAQDQTFVTLVYPDVPILVYAYGAGIAAGAVSSDSEIIGIVYMAPVEMAAFLNEAPLFTWQGYGALNSILSGDAVIPASNTDETTGDSG